MPIPVQDALTVVANSLESGPLTIDTAAGSLSSGVWVSTTENQSVGISQHWSLEASDSSGTIALGITVADDGMEVISGGCPVLARFSTGF
jgi:hypothetical protein